MDCPWCGAEAVTEEHIETCPKRPMWDVLAAWKWLQDWMRSKDTNSDQDQEDPKVEP